MKTILDTNVVSELRRERPDRLVIDRVRGLDASDLLITSVTFAELSYGAHRHPDGQKRDALVRWLDGLRTRFHGRVLTFDQEAAEIWRRRVAALEAQGRLPGHEDAQIAAIAIRFGARVWTRDTTHFAAMGCEVLNPWAAA